MMNDTISRQAAIDVVMGFMPSLTTPDGCGQFDREIYEAQEMFVDIGQALNDLPSAERRGRWEHSWGDEWCCSACGHVITTEGSWERPWQKYCEECGAKMMREDEEMSKVSEMEMAYAEYLND